MKFLSMTNKFYTTLLASSIALSGCQSDDTRQNTSPEYNDSDISSVNFIPENIAHTYTQTIKIVTQEEVNWVVSNIETPCNLAKVTIQEFNYNVGAKHCYQGYKWNNNTFQGKDIIMIKSFQKDFSKYWVPLKNYSIKDEDNSNTFEISNKNLDDIVKENSSLTVIWCLEHNYKNIDICVSIVGKASRANDGKGLMYISSEDQKRVIEKTGSWNSNFIGMSGCPVFIDGTDKLFWVLVENTKLVDGKKIMTLRIQPARDSQWNINYGLYSQE